MSPKVIEDQRSFLKMQETMHESFYRVPKLRKISSTIFEVEKLREPSNWSKINKVLKDKNPSILYEPAAVKRKEPNLLLKDFFTM